MDVLLKKSPCPACLHGKPCFGSINLANDQKSFTAAALTASMKNEIRQLTQDVADLQNVSLAGSENNRQTGKHATTVLVFPFLPL